MTITSGTDARRSAPSGARAERGGLGTRAKLTALAIAVVWPTLLIAAYCELSWHALSLIGGTFVLALVAAVVITSVVMGAFVRSTNSLIAAATLVRRNQDFAARATVFDEDELGLVNTTFNAMVERLEIRDRELDKHRRQVETTLVDRTRERDHQNQELRGVLDSIEQGVVLLDRAGMPSAERNAVFDRWFGAPEPGQTFAQIVGRVASPFAADFSQQWQQLIDGFLPVELNVYQLPRRFSTETNRHYQLSYRTLGTDPECFERLLVIVSDITESVEHARREADLSQLLGLLDQLSIDRGGFSNFFVETQELMAMLGEDDRRERSVVLRDLHTLKANFTLFGLTPLATLVHEIEDSCAETGQLPTEEDRLDLVESWQRYENRARPFLYQRAPTASVDRRSLDRLLAAIREQRPATEIIDLAGRLVKEPVAPKLARMGERARALALRLGKGTVHVEVEAEGVVAPSHLGWLWRVLPLVVANSVDHGLDDASERIAHGKPAEGRLRIAAIEQPSSLIIEVEDDGRGVDWERVRARAERLGLPARTHEELVSALFADELSTKERVDTVSGRGVGLSAVEAACHQHGARIGVVSERGKGALFRFVVDSDNDSGARGASERVRTKTA